MMTELGALLITIWGLILVVPLYFVVIDRDWSGK